MSYSTRENLADTERSLVFAKELAELYPEARIVDGRWFSGDVKLAECDVVELLPFSQRGERGRIDLFCGKRLASGGVIWSSEGFQAFRTPPLFMPPDRGSIKDDALRRALLEWAAK